VKYTAVAALWLVVPCLAAEPTPAPTGYSLPVGDAPAPAVVRDKLADAHYDVTQMDRARAVLAEEHGGAAVSKAMANLLEATSASGGGGYRWDGEAWVGGDLNRLVFKTEGEGPRRGALDAGDAQALYSRAVGRYTDIQAGVRYEFQPDNRTYATVAIESLLPYWFKVQAALFFSDRGDLFSRLEGHTDLRLTQRLILQPRLEISLAAQDVPDAGVGSGVSTAELGLRLRYEIRRDFAPYVGLNLGKRFGRTAGFARAARDDVSDTTLVLGVRGWF
jgi:copper resistance protein B